MAQGSVMSERYRLQGMYGGGKGAVAPNRQETAPVYSCPAGFDLKGKTCEKHITGQPRTVCSQGTLRGMECIIETPKQARCPAGAIQQGKNCIEQIQEPARRFCPAGFMESKNGCETQEQLPLLEVCEMGTREGPQCVTLEIAPPNVRKFCPPGFEEAAKGGCWKVTTYDCTPLQHGKGGAGLRGMIGKEGMSVPVKPKVSVIQQTCERKEGAPYQTEKDCPPGYTDSGKNCILKNYTPTSTKCSNGGPIETCFTVRQAPIQWECPAGTQMQGQICTSQRKLPEEFICTTGFDNGNSCIQNFHPNQVCDAGLTLSGGICIGLETAPPQVTVTVTCTGKNCVHQ